MFFIDCNDIFSWVLILNGIPRLKAIIFGHLNYLKNIFYTLKLYWSYYGVWEVADVLFLYIPLIRWWKSIFPNYDIDFFYKYKVTTVERVTVKPEYSEENIYLLRSKNSKPIMMLHWCNVNNN